MRKYDENGELAYEGFGKVTVWVGNDGQSFTVYDGISAGEEWEKCKLELEQYVTEIEGEMHVESADDAEAIQAIYDKWLETQQARYAREKEAEEAIDSIASALKEESDYYFSRPDGYDLDFDSHGGAAYDSLAQATGLSMGELELYLDKALSRVISEMEGGQDED